jgi:hypothetical protein
MGARHFLINERRVGSRRAPRPTPAPARLGRGHKRRRSGEVSLYGPVEDHNARTDRTLLYRASPRTNRDVSRPSPPESSLSRPTVERDGLQTGRPRPVGDRGSGPDRAATCAALRAPKRIGDLSPSFYRPIGMGSASAEAGRRSGRSESAAAGHLAGSTGPGGWARREIPAARTPAPIPGSRPKSLRTRGKRRGPAPAGGRLDGRPPNSSARRRAWSVCARFVVRSNRFVHHLSMAPEGTGTWTS